MSKRLASSKSKLSPFPGRTQDSNQGLNKSIHPLLLFPVLTNIFELITFNATDFKNFRLVCKDWAEVSLGRWRKEATLTLTQKLPPSPDDDNSDSFSEDRNTNGLSPLEFLGMVNMPEDPFQLLKTNNFRKYNIILSQHVFFNNIEKLIPWTKIGPLMTHLSVSGSSDKNVGRVPFQAVPNLESFTYVNNDRPNTQELFYLMISRYQPEQLRNRMNLNNQVTMPPDSHILKKLTKLDIDLKFKAFPIRWTDFFIRLPNIKELTLRSFPKYTCFNSYGMRVEELFILFQSLLTIREALGPGYFSQLSTLKLVNLSFDTEELLETILHPLRNIGLPITSLSLKICSGTDVSAFRPIFGLYSDTLEKLEISGGAFYSKYNLSLSEEFPYRLEFPNLRELCFHGTDCYSLEFLKKLPSLRVLELRHDCHQDIIATGNIISSGALKDLVLPQMEELRVNNEYWSNKKIVKGFACMMPNLKKLKIGLGNDGFGMLCQIWKDLESLTVEPNAITESAILGSVKGCKYSVPNITDLKELTSLTMGPSQFGHKRGLSGDSIVHGILACQKLKHLTLASPPKASKKAVEMLRSKFPSFDYQS
ncbi:unnamed protein product [Orchesella dallaii]|uniref:F-box domain-containing protein n=1 Tax=Orchesella dallaii TaxID=48710 RepID=A0ABP1RN15_9HEXA